MKLSTFLSSRVAARGGIAVLLSTSLVLLSYAQAPPAQTPAPQTPAAGAPQPPAPGRGQGRGRATQGSPASQKPPQTMTPQTYPAELVQRGQGAFSANCAFCHGRDTMGGETGPDLTRSVLVAEDVHGDKITPVIRNGRIDKGMPPLPALPDSDVAAIVAFIHDSKDKADSLEGNRRTVEVADLQTGNAQAGQQYFNGPGGCAKCHSATGDLAGLAGRLQGLQLFQRMLYPAGRGRGTSAATPVATIKLPSGQTVSGKIAYRDEFLIAITDAAGYYRSWPTSQVTVTVNDPLAAHAAQLGKYTNDDMHNVLAYLQTLK
jgi:cytochrome c oxidase cbb3-type subunit III